MSSNSRRDIATLSGSSRISQFPSTENESFNKGTRRRGNYLNVANLASSNFCELPDTNHYRCPGNDPSNWHLTLSLAHFLPPHGFLDSIAQVPVLSINHPLLANNGAFLVAVFLSSTALETQPIETSRNMGVIK